MSDAPDPPPVRAEQSLQPTVAQPRAPRPSVLLAIGAGGALGSVARYEIGLAAPTPPGGFPWATFWINVSGSALLGLLLTLVIERWPPTRYVRPFAGIGICGGYTTWSTFTTESVLLARDDHVVLAAAYVCGSLIGGLAATYLGVILARVRPRHRRRL